MRLSKSLKRLCTYLSLIILGIVYLVLFFKLPYRHIMLLKRRTELAELKLKHLQPYNPKLPTNYLITWKNAKKWKQAMPKYIIQRLKSKKNGFFIECGAFDGLFISNTLLLERSFNWTGLLIEADPAITTTLKRRNRKAWVADVCLSPKPYPMNITMTGAKKSMGHGFIPNEVIANDRKNKTVYTRKYNVQCYPLDMLLDAIGVTEVDYLSLDVEGVELDILKTIPWDRFYIKLISVEVRPSSKHKIKQYLESIGYNKINEIIVKSDMVHDHVYEKEEPEYEI